MPTPVKINLTEGERKLAIEEAHRRQATNEKRGLRGRNNGPSFGAKALDAHILGALGEMAIASLLHLKDHIYADAVATKGSYDLPGMIDVKTRKGHHRDLIVQKDENPSKKFVLVTIENEVILAQGWCHGKEAMNSTYWKDPAKGRPAYFVPQGKLFSIANLLLGHES